MDLFPKVIARMGGLAKDLESLVKDPKGKCCEHASQHGSFEPTGTKRRHKGPIRVVTAKRVAIYGNSQRKKAS